MYCEGDLGQDFPEGTSLAQLVEHAYNRFGRYVLEAEDPQLGLIAITLVTLTMLSAFVPLPLFILFAFFTSLAFLPLLPLPLFISLAFVLLSAFSLVVVAVGHAAPLTLRTPIRPPAIAFSFALAPCACGQNQNYRHCYPFCGCPSHDIVLSFEGILCVECILPDRVAPIQTFPYRVSAEAGRRTHSLSLCDIKIQTSALGPLKTEKLLLPQSLDRCLCGLFAQGFDLSFQIVDLLVEIGDFAFQ